MERNYALIVTILNRGFADQAMDAAKRAGAHGGTVLHARGSGIHEAEKFFGVQIQPEKEVVLILVQVEAKDEIIRAIVQEAGLNKEGRGLTFALPVDDVAGIVHLMRHES
jgi:nitrogen regulatory protein P-II 1